MTDFERPYSRAVLLAFRTALPVCSLLTTLACGTILPIDNDGSDNPSNPVGVGTASKTTGVDSGGNADDTSTTSTTTSAVVDGGATTATTPRRCAVGTPFTDEADMRLISSSVTVGDLFSVRVSPDGTTGLLSFKHPNDTTNELVAFSLNDTIVQTIDGVLGALASTDSSDFASFSNPLQIIFDRTVNGQTIFTATRASATAAWDTPKGIGHPFAGEVREPYIVGTNVYFTLTNDAEPSDDVFVATLDVTSGQLVNQKRLNVSSAGLDEGAAVVSADELEIFYVTTNGNDHIFHASRSAAAADFGLGVIMPTPINGTGSDDFDWPTWVSPDGCDLYALGKHNGQNGFRRFRRQPSQ